MNKKELLEMLISNAKEYSKNAMNSLVKNNHMNDIKIETELDNTVIDATVVDFINFVGIKQGIDLGFYTKDLRN